MMCHLYIADEKGEIFKSLIYDVISDYHVIALRWNRTINPRKRILTSKSSDSSLIYIITLLMRKVRDILLGCALFAS